MRAAPRRIVTGHSPDGVSIVVADSPVPVSRELPRYGVAFHEVWNTSGAPARITAEEADPTSGDVAIAPSPLGTKLRIYEFAPGSLDTRGLQSPMHRTTTIDYGIMLEGEITLILDDSEVTMRAGDVVVQRGTDHAWANRGSVTARVAFVIVDAAFDESLLENLRKLTSGRPRIDVHGV